MNTPWFGSATADMSATVRRWQAGSCCQAGLRSTLEQPEPVPPLPPPGGPQALSAQPRVLDVYAALPSVTGKLELEYEGELKGGDIVAREIIRTAVGKIYDKYAPILLKQDRLTEARIAKNH